MILPDAGPLIQLLLTFFMNFLYDLDFFVIAFLTEHILLFLSLHLDICTSFSSLLLKTILIHVNPRATKVDQPSGSDFHNLIFNLSTLIIKINVQLAVGQKVSARGPQMLGSPVTVSTSAARLAFVLVVLTGLGSSGELRSAVEKQRLDSISSVVTFHTVRRKWNLLRHGTFCGLCFFYESFDTTIGLTRPSCC